METALDGITALFSMMTALQLMFV